jgi:hypothetical protein
MLAKVPGNLFKNNRKLKRVEFYGNRITQVGSDLLSNLPDLTSAGFGDNRCTRDYAFNNRKGVEELIEKCPEVK